MEKIDENVNSYPETAEKKNKTGLTKVQCNALRGIAIIGIFLHNYCHWLNPMVKENEYQYIQDNVDWLTQVILNADKYLPMHLFSFFGHYGVPVFLFLSAYGLVKKYEKDYTNPQTATKSKSYYPTFDFIRYHFLKLFKMMIVGFVAFIMLDHITPGEHHYEILDVIAQLGLFNNVLPDPDRIIWPGPFWFFGLMLQLYIVYRLFIHKRSWKNTVALMVICLLLQFCFGPESDEMNRYRYNFMGGMLPFGLGILYARYFDRSLSKINEWAIMIVSTFLVFLFSYNEYGWALVPIFICTGGVSLVKILPQTVIKQLNWFGGISAALFICHPLTRKIFIPISRNGDLYEGLILYIIASVCLAWLFKNLLRRIPSPRPITSLQKKDN
nr:acyltransferase [Prevotella sp.]